METGATRMGAETLSRDESRVAAAAVSAPQTAPTLWGRVPNGIKTILKVAVVAGAVYFATPLLLQTPIIGGILGSVGTAIASAGSALMTGLEAVFVTLGGTPFGAAALNASASSAAAIGASGTAAAATALTSQLSTTKAALTTTAAATTAQTTAAVHTAPLVPDTTSASVSTPTPDVSPNQVAAIDPNTVLVKKAGMAATAAQHASTQNNAAVDLPDLPEPTGTNHGHEHLHDNSKMAKLGHFAYDEHEETVARRRSQLADIENKVSQWTDRVTKKPAATTARAETVRKRDSKYSTEVGDERTRLDPAFSGPSV